MRLVRGSCSRAAVLSGLLALVAPVTVRAGQAAPEAALPSPREVIDRSIKALGGRGALLKHQSRRAVGTFEIPAQGLRGTLELLAARPNLMALKVLLPGIGEVLTGYDGTVGWTVNPMTGPMLLEGKQLEQLRADSEFDAQLHDPTRYRSMETMALAEFEGKPAYGLRLVRHTGEADLEYFDALTGLPLGSVVTRESPMGPMKAVNVVSDYRSFGGVLVATRAIQKIMGAEQVISITAVEHDTVPPASFSPPAHIKALVK
ncbi:MAG: hypothetical protein LC804_25780 [Acidobacteria bacterium]|nr:hypothetical protein [Acidobacteriota bacterium]